MAECQKGNPGWGIHGLLCANMIVGPLGGILRKSKMMSLPTVFTIVSKAD